MVPEFLSKKVTLVVPSWISLILALGAVGLIVWFIKAPMQRDIVIYITSVIAGTGVILTAMTAIITLRAQTEQAERILRAQRELAQSVSSESQRREALDFMKRWNDPLLANLRHEIAVGIQKDEKFVTTDSSPKTLANVSLILNFFEMVALACKSGVANEDLCRDFFKSAMVFYKKRLTWYMDEWTKNHRQESAWEHLKKMASSWEA